MRISPLCALVLIPLAFAVLLPGCQEDPVIPGENSEPGVSISRDTQDAGGHQCLGYYQFIFDPDAIEFDVVPLRSSQLHMNVVDILNTTMGVAVVGVPSEHDPPSG